MAPQQEEGGWPLGLRPLNVRVGLARNPELDGSVSFNTLLTGSPTSSTASSSALDTESTGSFFCDKSITLGSLIGISSFLELSRRSTRGRIPDPLREKRSSYKSKAWLFSLCSRLSTDAVSIKNTPSLGHLLEAERLAASIYRRSRSPLIYGTDNLSRVPTAADTNALFVEGRVAPSRSSTHIGQYGERSLGEGLLQDDAYGAPLLFSCLCGNLTH
ncbi:uncharacterized protein At3g17950 [Coffea eugenioides]|uniref:Uncharacterized protein n=1 Tax=Coffea arabica TaxID=13443 RepID=A0A6P6SX40_COFAR|nr:uncharacterized protein At3g17950 [Coffea eugenioides]